MDEQEKLYYANLMKCALFQNCYGSEYVFLGVIY